MSRTDTTADSPPRLESRRFAVRLRVGGRDARGTLTVRRRGAFGDDAAREITDALCGDAAPRNILPYDIAATALAMAGDGGEVMWLPDDRGDIAFTLTATAESLTCRASCVALDDAVTPPTPAGCSASCAGCLAAKEPAGDPAGVVGTFLDTLGSWTHAAVRYLGWTK